MNYLIGILIFLLAMPAMAEDVYLCTSEHSAGIDFDVKNKVWYPTVITTGGKYIARKVKNKNHAWEIRRMGENSIFSHCKEDININGYLECGHNPKVELTDYPFTLNIQTLRFVIAYEGSYAVDKQLQEKYESTGDINTPSVAIGTCSQI